MSVVQLVVWCTVGEEGKLLYTSRYQWWSAGALDEEVVMHESRQHHIASVFSSTGGV